MTGTVEIDNLGIPPLAGVCTYEEASRPGHDVDAAVGLLKRFVYAETRLNKVIAAHLARTPEWEAKCAFGLHLWLDAEHGGALRRRVGEMREPPLHLDVIPDERLRAFFEEVIRAEDTLELLVGVYRVAKPGLIRAIRPYLADGNPMADYPSHRILRSILREEEEMVGWGERAIEALAQDERAAERARNWEEHLRAFLQAAGGIAGDGEGLAPGVSLPEPRSDGGRYEMDPSPRRDGRFEDGFNRSGVRRLGYVYRDEGGPWTDEDRVAALFYNRLCEMDVPEYLSPVIHETEGKPWGYYADLSRHLWDETRHAMLGEAGFHRLGIPFYKYPVYLGTSAALNAGFTPREAHVILWGIEQGLMPRKTGKGLQWDVAVGTGDGLARSVQDYDWADEVLHAQIGRRWLIPEGASRGRLKAESEELSGRWEQAIERLDSLSGQEDFWPRLVAEVRRRSIKTSSAT